MQPHTNLMMEQLEWKQVDHAFVARSLKIEFMAPSSYQSLHSFFYFGLPQF